MRSALTAPKGLIYTAGKFVPRRMGFVAPREPIICRCGQHVSRNGSVLEGTGAFECSCRSVVVVVTSLLTEFRVSLTEEEYKEIRERRWSTNQILDYVGARLPEVSDVA